MVPVLFFFAFLRFYTASLLGAFDGWRGFSRPGLVAGCEGFANCGVLSGSAACVRSCGLPVRLSGNLLLVPRRDRLLSRWVLWVFVVGPYERPPKMERPELLDDSSELESSLGRTRS